MAANKSIALKLVLYRLKKRDKQIDGQEQEELGMDPQELSNRLRLAIGRNDPLAAANFCALLVLAGSDILPSRNVAPAKSHPLEAYAESYEQMARGASDGRVDCSSVAIDIRNNMMPVTRGL